MFLYGREYGKWEAGAIEQIELPDQAALRDELAKDADLKEQVGQLRGIIAESVDQITQGIHDAVGRVHAVEVLSMWEGFSRFCRETLGLDALTLVRAYGLQRRDPAAEVRAAYPGQMPDDAELTRVAEQWRSRWARRFA